MDSILIALHGALATGLCLGVAAAFPFGLSRVVGDVMGLSFQFDPPPLIVAVAVHVSPRSADIFTDVPDTM